MALHQLARELLSCRLRSAGQLIFSLLLLELRAKLLPFETPPLRNLQVTDGAGHLCRDRRTRAGKVSAVFELVMRAPPLSIFILSPIGGASHSPEGYIRHTQSSRFAAPISHA